MKSTNRRPQHESNNTFSSQQVKNSRFWGDVATGNDHKARNPNLAPSETDSVAERLNTLSEFRVRYDNRRILKTFENLLQNISPVMDKAV